MVDGCRAFLGRLHGGKIRHRADSILAHWPILPGYAITVHKAQGMGLPSVIVEEDVFWGIRLPDFLMLRFPV